MEQIVAWITLASRSRGIDLLLGPRIGELLHTAGLSIAHARTFTMPIGSYGGRLGVMAHTDVLGVLSGVKLLVVSHGIIDAAGYDAMVEQARTELPQHQGHLPFYSVYGQK